MPVLLLPEETPGDDLRRLLSAHTAGENREREREGEGGRGCGEAAWDVCYGHFSRIQRSECQSESFESHNQGLS